MVKWGGQGTVHVVHDITYRLCKVLLGVTVAFHVDGSCKRVFLGCTVDRLQKNRYHSSQLRYRGSNGPSADYPSSKKDR